MLKHPNKRGVEIPEVKEMTDLFVAWIGVLFRRLGVGTCRISAQEIREGLGNLQFSAVREGEDYVITLMPYGEGEDAHDGAEN